MATLIQLPVAIVLGRFLAQHEFRGKTLIQSVLVLPMFLPPVAVGLLLLLLLAPTGALGGIFPNLLYTQVAAALAATVISFPLLLRHCVEAFANIPKRFSDVAATLGSSHWNIFWRVELPLARRGVVVGILLSFARGVSEFGATSVVAGVTPGSTETLATGLHRRLASGDDVGAISLAIISIVIGLLVVFVSEFLLRKEMMS